jgi:CubicO group peptidase (beta-lactamase class C family)
MGRLDRRQLLLGTGAALLVQPGTRVAAAEIDWSPAAPADVGFTPDLAGKLEQLVAAKRVWNLHAVVVVRSGRLVLERYFSGEDMRVGRASVRTVAFNADTLHDLRSVTKSVVGLLYGIALAQGTVPPPEAPLFASFPDYADLARAPGRDRLTLHHVLSMTMGTDWNEELPYTDPTNSEIMMEAASDRYRFILERGLVDPPGSRWTYNGGATALLGRIIANGFGGSLADFARKTLFDPLGIEGSEWVADKNGESYAPFGLRLKPRDLARIGQLLLNRGAWDGRPVVPAGWIERVLTPVVSCDEQRRFGYHWYIGDFAFKGTPRDRLERWYGAFGRGGQRLFVMPGLDLVVAINAGNYNSADQWVPPIRVMREVVLASVR